MGGFMNNKILLIAMIFLSVFITGCGHEQPKQVTPGTVTKQDNPTINSTGALTINQPQETFYGQWVIKKMIAYGRVGTWGSDDITKILGKKLIFSKEKASCFGERPED